MGILLFAGGRGGLQEAADHAQVQGFPEAPGAGDKVNLAGVVNKIADKMGFIDEVAVFVNEFFEIGDALFQLFHDVFSIAWFGYFIYAQAAGLKLSFFSTKRKLNKEKHDSRGGSPLRIPLLSLSWRGVSYGGTGGTEVGGSGVGSFRMEGLGWYGGGVSHGGTVGTEVGGL